MLLFQTSDGVGVHGPGGMLLFQTSDGVVVSDYWWGWCSLPWWNVVVSEYWWGWCSWPWWNVVVQTTDWVGVDDSGGMLLFQTTDGVGVDDSGGMLLFQTTDGVGVDDSGGMLLFQTTDGVGVHGPSVVGAQHQVWHGVIPLLLLPGHPSCLRTAPGQSLTHMVTGHWLHSPHHVNTVNQSNSLLSTVLRNGCFLWQPYLTFGYTWETWMKMKWTRVNITSVIVANGHKFVFLVYTEKWGGLPRNQAFL